MPVDLFSVQERSGLIYLQGFGPLGNHEIDLRWNQEGKSFRIFSVGEFISSLKQRGPEFLFLSSKREVLENFLKNQYSWIQNI